MRAPGEETQGGEADLGPGLVEAIAKRVVELLRDQPLASGGTMLTAQDVADRYRLNRAWVYEHASELGVTRIGNGAKPRLRFDSIEVSRRLGPAPTSKPSAKPARRSQQPADNLLPVYGQRAAG